MKRFKITEQLIDDIVWGIVIITFGVPIGIIIADLVYTTFFK